MLVRIHQRRRLTRRRKLEYVFLVAGLLAVDYYLWSSVSSNLYQMYEDWKFERTLRGQAASVSKFLVDESGLRRIIGLGTPPDQMPYKVDTRASSPVHMRHRIEDGLVGRLEIPRIHLRAMVREGSNARVLEHAVGHLPSSAFPGDTGNVALAAHRDTFFRALRDARTSDLISVSTLDGVYQYRIDSTRVVSPSDVSVLHASTGHELTLITCYPFDYVGPAPRRFIVHATQIASTPPQQQPARGS